MTDQPSRPVETALAAAFPNREVASITDPGPSWNEANETVRVAFADGDTAYLKVAADGDGTRIARERAVCAYLSSRGDVAVPRIVAADPTASVPYLATEPMAGEALLSRWDEADATGRETLVRAVGESLAHLHDRRFDEHGIVVGGSVDRDEGDPSLAVRTDDWSTVLAETVEEVRTLGAADRFARAFDAVLDAIDDRRDTLDDAPAALLHGDPARPNCVVTGDGGTPIGFLDWERAHVGDPARDLHRLREQQLATLDAPAPAEFVEALYAGYRDVAGSLPDGFEERAPIYGATWTLGYATVLDRLADFRDEPREAVATLIEAEVDRYLASLS